jgi:anti-sigma factor RsiW
MDINILMMDALDGTISPADRAALDAYLARHADERATFERMLAVDVALRTAPVASPAAGFSQRVMASAHAMPIAKPLKGRHVAAIIATNSALMAVVWVLCGIALFAVGMYIVQQPAVQPVIIVARSAAIYCTEALRLFTSVVRALVQQPLFWLISLVAVALVAAWLGVITRVLLPARRYAPN